MKIFVIVIIILLVFSVLLPFFNVTDLTIFLSNVLRYISFGFEFLTGIFKVFTGVFDPLENSRYGLILSVVVLFIGLWVFELIIQHIIGGKE